ncbi:hypothetical protein GGI35DRAFT_480307 [Trichoderma velutinum]
MGFVAFKVRDEHVPFGSLIHNDAVIYVEGGDSHVKYYIIVAVVTAISISFLTVFLNLQSRLSKGLPPRPYQRFFFRGLIRKHEQRVGSVPQTNGSPDFYNMANVTPGPVNDSARYAVYPSHSDGGDKFDSAHELTKGADEANALPVNEAPLGAPPVAVVKQ